MSQDQSPSKKQRTEKAAPSSGAAMSGSLRAKPNDKKPVKIFGKDKDGNLVDDAGFLVQCVDYYADNASEQLSKSLKETGFAVLKTHPIDFKEVHAVYDEWRQFLKMLDDKPDVAHKYLKGPDFDGYFPRALAETAKGNDKRDVKHYYHMYRKGRYPTEVTEKAREMALKLTNLGCELLKWIEQHMDPELRKSLKTPLSESISLDRTLYRILHYPAYDGTEESGAVRAAAHEDINFITILPVGSSRGLQVWSALNEQWYEVPQEAESIVVNIGDMLQELTNGEYVSTTHRVVKPADEPKGMDRMSTPCFIHAPEDLFLSAKYPTAGGYLMERLMELGDTSKHSKDDEAKKASPKKASPVKKASPKKK